jgi:glycosyltransferase involved in cell wall biosynthesis
MSYASCCVLSYRRAHFLGRCIDTLIGGASAPLELIVHDDGSGDEDVMELLAERQRLGEISTLITNAPGHNQGQGVAINRMFAVATGDPIIKIDHDLIFQPGWLAEVNRLMKAAPQIGLLSGFRYWHDPCDWRKTLVGMHAGWQEHEYIMGSFMAVRRACWEELGPFEEHSAAFAEDHIFQRKVTDSGRWVCGTPTTDLMTNQGYGLGPSTVVTPNGTVAPIHTAPWVL